jgi:hypothetical protein
MAIGPTLACVGSSIPLNGHYNVWIPSLLFCAGDHFFHIGCVYLLSRPGSEHSFFRSCNSVSDAQTLTFAIPNLVNNDDIFGVQSLTVLGGIGQGATTVAWVEGNGEGVHVPSGP